MFIQFLQGSNAVRCWSLPRNDFVHRLDNFRIALGAELFVRNKSGTTLTPAGNALAEIDYFLHGRILQMVLR